MENTKVSFNLQLPVSWGSSKSLVLSASLWLLQVHWLGWPDALGKLHEEVRMRQKKKRQLRRFSQWFSSVELQQKSGICLWITEKKTDLSFFTLCFGHLREKLSSFREQSDKEIQTINTQKIHGNLQRICMWYISLNILQSKCILCIHSPASIAHK